MAAEKFYPDWLRVEPQKSNYLRGNNWHCDSTTGHRCSFSPTGYCKATVPESCPKVEGCLVG